MKVIISTFFILSSLMMFSQDQAVSSGYLSTEKKEQIDIVNRLEPIFQQNPTNELALQLAESLLYLKKYKKAISYYEFVLDNDKLDEKQTFKYFTALFEFGDTRLAMEVAKEYYIKFGRMDLKSKVDSFEKLKKSTPIFFENYISMNSKGNEFGMYPLFADYRIFNTDADMSGEQQAKGKKTIVKPYIFSLTDLESETPTLKPLVAEIINSYAISHFDEKDKKVYITSTNSNKYSITIGEQSTMKIYIADIDQHFKLRNLKEFKYNSPNFSVGHACVTRDGMNLYFVSDMPGGFGGTDIYRCLKLEDGSWGNPINVGNSVNSENNEMYPYISPKGNTLYFSSNGHSVFGGLDINKSQKTRHNTFGKPQNLGLPFNSNKDDYAIVFIDDKGNEGFFSSSRAEGKGGVDIYHFKYDQGSNPEPEEVKKEDKKAVKVIDGKSKSNPADEDLLDFHDKNSNTVIAPDPDNIKKPKASTPAPTSTGTKTETTQTPAPTQTATPAATPAPAKEDDDVQFPAKK